MNRTEEKKKQLDNPASMIRLKDIAEKVLDGDGTNYYDELKCFFDKFIYPPNQLEERYTLFVTRRCSCLAYIFKRILEEENEQRESGSGKVNSNNHLLTNTALLNSAVEIAHKIVNNERTKVVMVDDSISYGRALTNLLQTFRSKLEEALKEAAKDWPEKKRVNAVEIYMKKNVSIHVFIKKKQKTILTRAYKDILFFEKNEMHATWNDFSTRVSELILNADVANAAFALSVGINYLPIQCDNWRCVKTRYRNHYQRTFFRAFPNEENYKAICAIRCFPCSVNVRYRMVPFIFLKEMNTKQLEKLEEAVFVHKDKLLFTDNLKEYQDQRTLRSRMEFVTFYLSWSLMLEFYENAQLSEGTELCGYDSEKISWNYRRFGDNKRNPLQRLSASYEEPNLQNKEIWLSTELISKLFEEVFDDGLYKKNFFNGDKIPFWIEDQSMDKLVEKYEEFLFDRGIEAERESHILTHEQFTPSESFRARMDYNRRQDLHGYLSDFLEDYVSEIEDTEYSLTQILSVTLQLMDAGLMSIVIQDSEDDNNILLLPSDYQERGILRQQVRVCEQALCTIPSRFFDVLPILSDMCDEYGWADSKIFGILLQEVMKPRLEKVFCNKMEMLEAIPDMLKFMKAMHSCGQKISYWLNGTNRRFKVKEAPCTGIEKSIMKK